MIRILGSIGCLLLVVQIGFSQIKLYKNPESKSTVEVVQWEVNDLVYKLQKDLPSPFEKEAFAIVTDAHRSQKIPLFYNGNQEWIFRYSSSTTGRKSFVIKSEITELDGRIGSFLVKENKKKDRHGGVMVGKENPRRFFYEDGSHYFNLAFECDWLYALDYQDEDLPKTKHLLSLLKANGFNQIVMNVYAYGLDLDWVRDERLNDHPEHNYGEREDIFPFLGSNSNPDYSALNLDFFKHLDRVVAEMHQHEIISHLMIYVWNKRVAWPEPGSKADDMYYDHVIKRYQAFPNIIWDVSKEAKNQGTAEKRKYRVTNWSNYEQALVGRGNIRLWLDGDLAKVWHHDEPRSTRESIRVFR